MYINGEPFVLREDGRPFKNMEVITPALICLVCIWSEHAVLRYLFSGQGRQRHHAPAAIPLWSSLHWLDQLA